MNNLEKNKLIHIFFIILILFCFKSKGFPLEQDNGIIFGNNVNLRSGPGLTHGIIGKCDAGLIVVIIDKTSKRDVLDKSIDAFGYHWFNVRLSSGTTGWIYGRYMYPVSSKSFYNNKKTALKIQGKALPLDKQYYFSIAKEPSFPVITKEGLTGSTIHGLPFIYIKSSYKAVLIWIDKDTPEKIIFREKKDRNTWFRLLNDEGVGETVSLVKVINYKGSKALEIHIEYISQESSGKYSITAVPTGTVLHIKSFRILEGPGW